MEGKLGENYNFLTSEDSVIENAAHTFISNETVIFKLFRFERRNIKQHHNEIHKSMRLLLLLIFSIIFTSCSGQEDVQIKLTIHNNSGKTLDSIAVYDLFKGHITYYDVKKDSVIEKLCINKRALLPKGESTVFYIYAFDKNQYYRMENGFIGFPTASLEDEYEFYIWETYISNKKDYVPPTGHTDQRYSMEEYRKIITKLKLPAGSLFFYISNPR